MSGTHAKLTRHELMVLMRRDFSAFVHRCFLELHPGTPYRHNWHIDVIAAKLDACRLGKIRRLIINMPPRHLKSLAGSVAFVAWLLGHYPSARILGVSYGQDLGLGFSRQCRRIMETPWYKALFSTRLSDERAAVDEFMTTAQGCRITASAGGPLTGRGADFTIIDDPAKPEEALSEANRKSINDWFGNTLYGRLNDKAQSSIVLIMQRLHEDDLAGHLLAQGGWELLSLPAIATEDEIHVVDSPYGRVRYSRGQGEPLHGGRESLATLAETRKILGEYNFAAQYLQSPAPLEGGMVKLAWFGRYEPNHLSHLCQVSQIVQSWDSANKATELSDYSVCTTWGIWGKQIYLLDVLRKRLDYPELKRTVGEHARAWRAQTVLIEDKASGTQLIQELLASGMRTVKPCKPLLDKVMRMHAQTAAIENGFVSLPTVAPWLAEYEHEVIVFPNGKYDDQVDSTSQALTWINELTLKPRRLVYGTVG